MISLLKELNNIVILNGWVALVKCNPLCNGLAPYQAEQNYVFYFWKNYTGYQYVYLTLTKSNRQQLHLFTKLHNYSDGNMFLRSHADNNLLVSIRTHTTY